jgi:bacterioferritin
MKGHPDVIATLNALLADELAAIDQYLAHAHKLRHWGYTKLADRIHHEVTDEKSHADALIHRVLFLEGEPDMTRGPLTIGSDVKGIFELDLAVELRVQGNLNRALQQFEKLQDFGSYEVLLPLLKDTEVDHIDWLEQQLGLIKELGLPLYLAQQL